MSTTTTPQKNKKTVLHVLSQRPGRTGSGVTLDAMVRLAQQNWKQHAIVGTPASDPQPALGDLTLEYIHPLVFGNEALPFALPGMSDVMPYKSSKFSNLDQDQIDLYCAAWTRHLQQVIQQVQPDLIYSHHIWLLSSMLRDVAPDTPILTHCHATGLRQMQLCPGQANRVRQGCARNNQFLVLHQQYEQLLASELDISPERIHCIGAGFRQDVFHARDRNSNPGPTLVYAGKLSRAKGLPWLLKAVENLLPKCPELVLHVAGSGAGDEASQIQQQMDALKPAVVAHGMLSPPDLAELFRQSAVFVLPSFYEGLPLVLVEAAACGCRLISTRLEGVTQQLEPALAPILQLVPLPRLRNVDVPLEQDLPLFVANLQTAIETALQQPPPCMERITNLVEPLTWDAVFEKVETVWLNLVQE